MISAEATEQISVPDLRQLLAAVFTRAMDNPRHAKALEIVASRLDVVFGQLDLLRKLSTVESLPDWYRTSGSWVVADAVCCELSALALALRDAQQKAPQSTDAVH